MAKATARLVFSVFAILFVFLVQAVAASESMTTGSRTTQPIGHFQFCQRAPEECQKRARVHVRWN